MRSLRPFSTSLATLAILFTVDVYASGIRDAPAQRAPPTPRPHIVRVDDLYLRRDQQLGSGAYALEPAGELPDIEPPAPQQNHAPRAYGSRRMGEMSYERSSSLPKPTE